MYVHVGILVLVQQGKGREAMKGLWGSDDNTYHNLYIFKISGYLYNKDTLLYLLNSKE